MEFNIFHIFMFSSINFQAYDSGSIGDTHTHKKKTDLKTKNLFEDKFKQNKKEILKK